MKKREIKRSLRRGFSQIAPKTLSADVTVTDQGEETARIKKPIKLWKPLVASAACIAACAAVLIVMFGGTVGIVPQNAANTMVFLDVNPSVALRVNDDNVVVQAMPLNDDGKALVRDVDLTDILVEKAMGIVLDEMVDDGYINKDDNSLLISVQDGSRELRDRLTAEAKTTLDAHGFDSAVYGQTYTFDRAIKEQADAHRISEGKTVLVRRIVQNDPVKTFDALAPLSINELYLLADKTTADSAVVESGSASESAYIGRDAAMQAALAAAGLTQDVVSRSECELDHEHGMMVYEVEWVCDGYEYEYDIDATTGEILKEKKKADDKDDNDDDWAVDPTAAYADIEAVKADVLAHAGVAAADAVAFDVELDREGGVIVYEIDFCCGTMEYEYTVDALTGKILFDETETDDDMFDDDDDDDYDD